MQAMPSTTAALQLPARAATGTARRLALDTGYLVLDPYSYSQTFNIGEVPADATFVTVQFAFDFLVQTTPTSNEFAKQTASDTLTIAIAGGGGSGAETPAG